MKRENGIKGIKRYREICEIVIRCVGEDAFSSGEWMDPWHEFLGSFPILLWKNRRVAMTNEGALITES